MVTDKSCPRAKEPVSLSHEKRGLRAAGMSRRLAGRFLPANPILLVGLLPLLAAGSAHAQGLTAPAGASVDAVPQALDLGDASTGVTVNQDFTHRIPLFAPSGKGAASRSFERLATLAPGAHEDTYGVSINGTTSPENAFRIDGVVVNNPAYGILGTPLSIEFVNELNVVTSGYLPEYGRAMGGIYDVTTKTGSNEPHGSVFFNISPGLLEGGRSKIASNTSVITTNPRLGALRDFGADVGGPILRDKLWFYAGVQAAFTRTVLDRTLKELVLDEETGQPSVSDALGLARTFPIPNGVRTYYADEQAIQYIGKLTYSPRPSHRLTLSVFGTPTTSGGNGTFSNGITGAPEVTNIHGTFDALAHRQVSNANDVSLRYSGSFNDRKQMLDITLGWHHQRMATLPSDGSSIGDTTGLASVPRVIYRRNQRSGPDLTSDTHTLADFESVPVGSCKPVVVRAQDDGSSSSEEKVFTPCPVDFYLRGGPGYLDDASLDSYQGRAVFTQLLHLVGHHVIRAGVDVQLSSHRHVKAFSGTNGFRENNSGSAFDDELHFGVLRGRDAPVVLTSYTNNSSSTAIGGFVQDSWSIMDVVTLNAGIRYDAQMMYGSDGALGLSLANQWSPRVGVIYDFTQQGRSRLFASYAIYQEGVPLDLANRAFPSEPKISSSHNAASAAHPGGCDPFVAPRSAGCTNDAERRALDPSPSNPNPLWSGTSTTKVPVDPEVSAQSSVEIVVGGDYEIFPGARAGITYTHQSLLRALEDMSRDEGSTLFLGNPGLGGSTDFPKAVRDYDAVTVFFQKSFSRGWLGQASYTWSRLHGNYPGLFRPEDAQLDPNITSTFDAKSLLPNTTGLLPADRTHAIKVYGSRDFLLPGGVSLLLGATFRTRSGTPLSTLGDGGSVFLAPRGSDRNDWIHDFDLRLGASIQLSKASTASISVDIFNLFNFQGVTSRDQVLTKFLLVRRPDGSFDPEELSDPRVRSANFRIPTSFQAPRQLRLGAKVTF